MENQSSIIIIFETDVKLNTIIVIMVTVVVQLNNISLSCTKINYILCQWWIVFSFLHKDKLLYNNIKSRRVQKCVQGSRAQSCQRNCWKIFLLTMSTRCRFAEFRASRFLSSTFHGEDPFTFSNFKFNYVLAYALFI